MIHPINIPEDLFAPNPERPFPEVFRKRTPFAVAGYGVDGRAFSAEGAPVEPLSPGTHWKNTFLRSFIRRLAIKPDNDVGVTHHPLVDIVDLSASPSADALQEKKMERAQEETHQNKQPQKAAEEKTQQREETEETQQILKSKKTQSQKVEAEEMTHRGRAGSVPDRPTLENDDEDEDDDEAEGDQLVRAGSTLRRHHGAPEWQRVSRKTIRSILTRCCGDACGDESQLQEFARFDFSQFTHLLLDSHDVKNDDVKTHQEGEEVELLPEQLGSRLWTCRRRATASATSRANIRFSVASVRILPAKCVRIGMVAHRNNDGAGSVPCGALTLQIEVHVHLANACGEIGQCLKVVEDQQTEILEEDKDIKFVINIKLDQRIRSALSDEKNKFLLITVHGKLSKC